MKHITTDKGDIGVLKVSANLVENGYPIFMPVSATCPFDLLVFKNSKFLRVQVKYRTIRNGKIEAHFNRAVINNGKQKMTHNDFVDVIAIYCPDNDKCYFVQRKNMKNLSCVNLRFIESKNGQLSGVRMANDFEKL